MNGKKDIGHFTWEERQYYAWTFVFTRYFPKSDFQFKYI